MITTIDSIKQSIASGEALRAMSEAYSELYVAKLDKVRVMIERNRAFAASLAAAFHEVKVAASQAGIRRQTERKPRLRVAIFSNYGFFMNLETKMAQMYITNSSDDSDLLVIGRAGGEVLRNLEYKKPFDILIFSRDLPRPEELATAQKKMSQYDSISVIYPQFQTMGRQTPTMVDISGGQLRQADQNGTKPITSILEPEAPVMLEFFESQILGLLLEQAFLETELAHAAARLLMMDAAQGRAKDYVFKQKRQLRSQLKQRRDSKILELSLQFLARQDEQ
jgi:F0F1-type ATP synthase gamma subunit